jgi:hypothetical protein
MKNWPRWRNLKWTIASHSLRICVADSCSSRHVWQVGSSVSPKLKRCTFRWQRPVNSPAIRLNWSLFNFNRFFVLLVEGPDMSPCLRPIVDSHCFIWFLFAQSLATLLATSIEMPQAGSRLVNRWSDPVLASRSAVSLRAIPSWPNTHISWTPLCMATPDQFWDDLVFSRCFNCSLTIW